MELINVTHIKSTYFLLEILKNNISEELCYGEIEVDDDDNDGNNDVGS